MKSPISNKDKGCSSDSWSNYYNSSTALVCSSKKPNMDYHICEGKVIACGAIRLAWFCQTLANMTDLTAIIDVGLV